MRVRVEAAPPAQVAALLEGGVTLDPVAPEQRAGESLLVGDNTETAAVAALLQRRRRDNYYRFRLTVPFRQETQFLL